MTLSDIFEFKIPLTVISLRAWPSPTKGEQHSGIQSMVVDPSTNKVKLPNRKKRKAFFDKSVKDQTSGK